MKRQQEGKRERLGMRVDESQMRVAGSQGTKGLVSRALDTIDSSPVKTDMTVTS